MLQGFSVENFRSIDSVSIPDLKVPAVFSAEQGRDPGDIRDSLFLAARSFPGGRDGSWLLTGGDLSSGVSAEGSWEGTSFTGSFKECSGEGTSSSRSFRECVREGASFISMSHTWVLMNPDNDIVPGFADKKRSGAGEFREICRLFGERFGVVSRIILKNEVTYEDRPLTEAGNILSYQMLEITVDRAFASPLTGFYELVVYPGGMNYDLYWDTLPDVHRMPVTGRAKGCSIRMSGLEIRNIVTDGVQDGADFDMILPTIMRLSEYPGRMFRDLVYADAQEEQREQQCSGLREVSGRTSGSSLASRTSPASGEMRSNRRVPWIAPDGELVHSVVGEAVDAWLACIEGTDTGRSGLSESAGGVRCGVRETTDIDPVLLAALLAAPVGGTILLAAPLSAYKSEVRTRFIAFVSAQAKLEKSVLIADEPMRE